VRSTRPQRRFPNCTHRPDLPMADDGQVQQRGRSVVCAAMKPGKRCAAVGRGRPVGRPFRPLKGGVALDPPLVMARRRYKRLEWAMRVVTFLCFSLQANFVLFGASWQRASWWYTTAVAAIALIVAGWSRRQQGALPGGGQLTAGGPRTRPSALTPVYRRPDGGRARPADRGRRLRVRPVAATS
jgi:hypothetical protein